MGAVFKFLRVKPIYKYNHKEFKDAYNNKWKVNSSFQKNLKNPFDYDFKKINELWRKKLSLEEIRFVETICQKYMDKFGYIRMTKKI